MQVQNSTLSTLFLCLFHCTRNTMNIFIYLLKSSFQNLKYPQPNLRASSPDKKCLENNMILHNLRKNPANILSGNSLMETLNTVWLSWSTLWLQTTYLTFILVQIRNISKVRPILFNDILEHPIHNPAPFSPVCWLLPLTAYVRNWCI